MFSKLFFINAITVFYFNHFFLFCKGSDRAVNAHGCPVASLTTSLTVGKTGQILLQDTNLVEHLAAFDRERIPERVVHAKGAGEVDLIMPN